MGKHQDSTDCSSRLVSSRLDLYKQTQTSWESGMDDWIIGAAPRFCDVWYRVRLRYCTMVGASHKSRVCVQKRRRSPYVAYSHPISHFSLLPSQPLNILSVSPSFCSPETRTTKGSTAASHPNHGSVTISLPFVLPSPTMLGFLRFPASSAHVALQIDLSV